MPNDGAKQRKGKPAPVVNNEETKNTHKPREEEEIKRNELDYKPNSSNLSGSEKCAKASWCCAVDVRSTVSLLSVAACVLLLCVVHQQNEKLNNIEKKYTHLYGKASDLLELEKKFIAVSEKHEQLQVLLASQEVQLPLSELNSLKQEVAELQEWTSGFSEQRQQLQKKLSSLILAVESIENRTTAISNDVTAKVASVRTDVRRMGGLEGDVDALLTQTSELENKVAQAEKHMAKRIGELLATSIDRVSGLRSATEKNTQNLEQIRRRINELHTADKKLSERILALESGRAKLLKTLTFASDLRPKISTFKREFAMVEPQLTDLTLRIGHLAEEVIQREEDIVQIKESLATFATFWKDIKQAEDELAVKSTADILQENGSTTLMHTDL